MCCDALPLFFFLVCSFIPHKTHYFPLMDTGWLTDWQNCHTSQHYWAPLYLSRRLQPPSVMALTRSVTACSYFPQLLTIVLYLKDGIWSKLDSFIIVFWACGLFDATRAGRHWIFIGARRLGGRQRTRRRTQCRTRTAGWTGTPSPRLSEDVHFRHRASLSLKENPAAELGVRTRLWVSNTARDISVFKWVPLEICVRRRSI